MNIFTVDTTMSPCTRLRPIVRVSVSLNVWRVSFGLSVSDFVLLLLSRALDQTNHHRSSR